MGRLNVNLCGIELDSPIIPSSGTFGYGYEFCDFYDINILPTFVFKGTTLIPRYGYPLPRIADCQGGMLNSVGLENPGIDEVISKEIPKIQTVFHKPIIANISGTSMEDYIQLAKKLNAIECIGWIEVNISCPNIAHGGLAFGTDVETVYTLTKLLKQHSHKPIIMKLSPNVTDIISIARACEDAGADAISLINTLRGMRIDLRTRRPILANEIGGYSGPGIFPIALRMVYEVSHAVKIPIIGMGGIQTTEDVLEMLLAGATCVQIGSENLRNPMICKELIESLPQTLDKYNIQNIKELKQ